MLSFDTLTSQPSVSPRLQFTYGDRHDETWQTPFMHTGVACAGAHTALQAPQLVNDVLRLVSQPLSGVESQAAYPEGHPVIWQSGLHTPSSTLFASSQTSTPMCK